MQTQRHYPIADTWYRADIAPMLCRLFVDAGYPPFHELLIDAMPYAGIHLPGHTEGSICLWDPRIGALFTGDLVYDGPLVYEGPGMNLDIYAQSLRKLKELPVKIVHAGHDPSFDRERMVRIIDQYLSGWNLPLHSA